MGIGIQQDTANKLSIHHSNILHFYKVQVIYLLLYMLFLGLFQDKRYNPNLDNENLYYIEDKNMKD